MTMINDPKCPVCGKKVVPGGTDDGTMEGHLEREHHGIRAIRGMMMMVREGKGQEGGGTKTPSSVGWRNKKKMFQCGVCKMSLKSGERMMEHVQREHTRKVLLEQGDGSIPWPRKEEFQEEEEGFQIEKDKGQDRDGEQDVEEEEWPEEVNGEIEDGFGEMMEMEGEEEEWITAEVKCQVDIKEEEEEEKEREKMKKERKRNRESKSKATKKKAKKEADPLTKDHNRCPECGMFMDSLTALENHFRRHHPDRVPCPHCESKFPAERDRDRHVMRVHTAKPRLICEECGLDFKDKDILRSHTKAKHRVTKFVCPVSACGMEFRNKYRLWTHKKKLGHGTTKVRPVCHGFSKKLSHFCSICTGDPRALRPVRDDLQHQAHLQPPREGGPRGIQDRLRKVRQDLRQED